MKGILAQNGDSRKHCEDRGWVCCVYPVKLGAVVLLVDLLWGFCVAFRC